MPGKPLIAALRYIYTPALARHSVRKSALRHLIDTFYEGSTEKVVAALLGESGRLLNDQLNRIADLVSDARKNDAKKEGGR